ncbi:MAG: type II secretion system F family protein [Candidatus Aceula lacicola]|nr:type II secretion system F family protein [Candidatus Aceula lacicola]
MPDFLYVVKNEEGKTIKGSLSTVDKDAAVEQLQKQGYFIISVNPAKKDPSMKFSQSKSEIEGKRKFSHKRVKIEDKLLFSRQLATMLESGVNLLRSLNVIVLQVESEEFYKVLCQVRDDVEQGVSLSLTLSKFPKYFDSLWVSLTEIGEASGTMPRVLNKLAFYVERKEAFRSAIISAVIYPAILFSVSIGAILFFALFIGPRFKVLYDSLDAELPALTQTMLNVFDTIKTKFFLITGVFCAIFIIAKKYFKTPVGQRQLENFLFGLPGVGHVMKTIVVERFTSQMSILVESGVPILYALDIGERMIGNKICEDVLKEMKSKVREGKLISEEMIRTGFFPPMASQMIAIGEETGELGKMLDHVAEYYQRYVQTFMTRFSTIFEPFILVFMGGTIGLIVLSMFLPIFNIASMGG